MPKVKGLTPKQRKFIDVYLDTFNGTEAAMQAYDCKDRESASAIATENLGKLSMPKLMEEAGLSDALLLKKLYEGLDANKVISANITYGDADGQTNDFIEVPDWSNRHKFLNTALELKGKKSGDQTNIQVNVKPILGDKKAE